MDGLSYYGSQYTGADCAALVVDDELRVAIDAWVRRYNERRPHQSLGWKTPAEYRAEHLGADYPEAA
jgi:transposase InsO family protein